MRLPRTPLVAAVARWASRRRFPVLLGLTVALLLVNLLVPDPVPFLDELVLALCAAVLASWRRPEVQEAVGDGRAGGSRYGRPEPPPGA